MRLYVPTVGDVLRLTAPWEFSLVTEYRNKTLCQHLEPEKDWAQLCGYGSWHKQLFVKRVTLPVGLDLIVDRIYLAKGAGKYHSLTFRIAKGGVLGNKKQIRFWAKLDDVNTIEYERPTVEK